MKIRVLWLMISLKVFSLQYFIGPISAFRFLHVPRPYAPPMSLDTSDKDEENQIVHPFSHFFSFFRPMLPFYAREQTDSPQNTTSMTADDSQKMKTDNTWIEKANITGPISAFSIFRVPRPYAPPMSLDTSDKDEENRIVHPFSHFFSFLRPRNVDPMLPFYYKQPTDSPQDATTMTANNSQKMKMGDTWIEKESITAATGSEYLTGLVPKQNGSTTRYEVKSLGFRNREEEDTDVQPWFHPIIHSRIFRFPRFRTNPLKTNSSGDEERKENKTQLENQSANPKVDDKGKIGNNSGANCTNHFYSTYFFMWTSKLASLGAHVVIILLLSALVTFAILFCHPNCPNQHLKIRFQKSKPLTV